MEIKVFSNVDIDVKNVGNIMFELFEDSVDEYLPIDFYITDIDAKTYNKLLDKVIEELQKHKKEEREEN